MEDTVVRVSKTNIIDNPAAVSAKIDALIAAKYPPPFWVRKGPNFAENSQTGEVVNLNQEAIELLQAEGPREDAVAVIQTPAGEEKTVWVHQDAVKAAGGNMEVLQARLQSAIDAVPLGAAGLAKLPSWVLIAGGVVAAGLLVKAMNPSRGRR